MTAPDTIAQDDERFPRHELAFGAAKRTLLPTTKSDELALIGALFGWGTGLLVGANMKKVEVLY
jgi:hypothetical protein